jgi:alkanesulfonate monooxygenase SsuD/methylene tetrahydromethanopterin reductase-like flavin-dependent oxidoreductase (luciferase family)
MAVRLGLVLKVSWTDDQGPAARLADLVMQVRVARDAGFESIWLSQHFVGGPGRSFQTVPLLGRLAPELAGMRLGTSIILLPMLNPVLLAEEMATLDWMVGGRLLLGVGLGYLDHEYAAMQTPRTQRVGRFTEAIEVMRKLWTGDPVHHDGKYFPLDGVRTSLKPKQDGGPPVLIGAGVDAAIRRAARIGDGWLITFATDRLRAEEQLAMFRAARAEAGLPPVAEQTIGRDCYVGATMASALDDAGGPLLSKYEGYRNIANSDVREGQVAEQGHAFMENRFLVGDEAFVRDEMQRYRETLDIDMFRLRMEWDGLPHDKLLESIKRAGHAAEGVR